MYIKSRLKILLGAVNVLKKQAHLTIEVMAVHTRVWEYISPPWENVVAFLLHTVQKKKKKNGKSFTSWLWYSFHQAINTASFKNAKSTRYI